jgi:hypothetical protein
MTADDVTPQIDREIYAALGADEELLAIVGSWRSATQIA